MGYSAGQGDRIPNVRNGRKKALRGGGLGIENPTQNERPTIYGNMSC